jgi:hypothetical protein
MFRPILVAIGLNQMHLILTWQSSAPNWETEFWKGNRVNERTVQQASAGALPGLVPKVSAAGAMLDARGLHDSFRHALLLCQSSAFLAAGLLVRRALHVVLIFICYHEVKT